MSEEKEKRIFSNNLNYYMRKFNKTQADIVSDLGINKSTISTWCNGTKMPRMGTIQALADYFKIRKSDLVEDKTESNKLPLNAIPIGQQHKLPIFGSVCAGNGIFAEQNIIGYENADIKYTKDNYFYLRVKGDSMSPQINEGDLVLVQKDAYIVNGDIAIVTIDDTDGVIKKIKYSTNEIELISFNPYYPPRKFVGAEMNNITIVGKVIESKRKW